MSEEKRLADETLEKVAGGALDDEVEYGRFITNFTLANCFKSKKNFSFYHMSCPYNNDSRTIYNTFYVAFQGDGNKHCPDRDKGAAAFHPPSRSHTDPAGGSLPIWGH